MTNYISFIKIIILLLFLYLLTLSAQSHNLEENFVKGFISSEYGTFLILDDGYIKLPELDPYEEYYRTIYNDSTIVNPNRIVSGNFSLNIIPYLIPEINTDNNIYLEEPLRLGMFINLNSSNQYQLSNYGFYLLDSLTAE